jgi:hypothetical protein
MRIKTRFRDVRETDKQILWQKKVIRSEMREGRVNAEKKGVRRSEAHI